ncbi:hypothetical protein NQ318_020186 [Aromia moschata]|uniref:ABC-three component systems C-terminal domain-containing protein n=1 Tax=Aromia moschata TaxID=1265417 RepID=A0AAV8ZCM4_9CUCU|nr:hypothetical protein NQ318_020186 [Aromia moschata]
MVSNTDLGFLALTLVAFKRKKQQKKKRRWSKEWYKMRNRFTHEHFLNFLRDSEPEDYRNFLRTNQESFDYLLELVRPDIEKNYTNMREVIPASQKLSITLRYLAYCIDLEDLKFTCAIAPQTLEFIIMETCSAITKSLNENIQGHKFTLRLEYFGNLNHQSNSVIRFGFSMSKIFGKVSPDVWLEYFGNLNHQSNSVIRFGFSMSKIFGKVSPDVW